jgi:L,D-transpeptidase catalytic domain
MRRITRIGAGLLLATLALLALVAGPANAAPRGFLRMSDERTRTWSAWVERRAWVRAGPSGKARRRTLLRTDTFHGSPELVVVLGALDIGDKSWFRIRYSGLGRRTGWVLASALSEELGMTDRRLVLDRRGTRLRLLRGRRVLFSTRVGVGAVGSPTPAGRYYIRERLGPFRSSNSIYGALAFGTSAYSPFRTDWPGGGQVGIHGTNQPSLIPGRISNGCVRLRNAAVLRLGRMLRVGTPLQIR